MDRITSTNVLKELRKVSSVDRAKSNEWFFKTGPGEYGYGDKFIGVSVPNTRKISQRFNDLSLSETKKLLDSKFHESRLAALFILVAKYQKGDSKIKEKICKFYLKNLSQVNNWDLVDSSAHKILGPELKNQDRFLLYELAESKSLWKRRVALISTFAFIKEKDFDDSLKICELYLNDSEDLIHKATGWTLREIGKVHEPTLINFLNTNYKQMPRTALRYCLERLDAPTRKKYMKK